jgi:outer membrane protein assembly factor BamB
MGGDMNRRRIWLGGLLLSLAFFGLATRADALITRLSPLSGFISESTFIFTAKVDAVDPDKPSLVLTFDENLKGKFPFQRLPINLKGDAEAEKLKHRPMLLKRVAPKMPLVVFVTQMDKEYIAFCYTNGTWFQLTGEKPDGADTVRWSFTHIEPYLRRTYKGTTAEMKQTLTDAISGKKKPPEVNAKEEPGVGPEIEPERSKDKEKPTACGLATGPVFSVIPAVMVGGPLAILAMLFPSVFGGWKRWLSLISVTCTTSTIYWLYYSFASPTSPGWWNSTFAYWMVMTLATLAGTFWAWQRHIQRLLFGEAPLRPGKLEQLLMIVVSLFALGTIVYYRWSQMKLLTPDGMPVIVFAAGVWVGTVFVLLKGSLPARMPVLATEVVVLTTMSLVSTGLLFFTRNSNSEARSSLVFDGASGQSAQLVWKFDLPDKGAVASSPLVVGERVYIAAAHDSVFRPYGALYCLDRSTGKANWSFNNGKKMKQVFSTPMVVDDLLYIGEGFHQDSYCKIYCLKAMTGEKVWEFETQSHTESNPCVVAGKVYCGAGDDGLYCLDAKTGAKRWHFNGFHVDAGPLVVGDKVFCGAGTGDVYKETIFFCLDAQTGDVKWKIATEQPVWSSPSVEGRYVYFGMGNGRLNESDPKPAGAVVCVDAEDRGKEVWRHQLGDAVLSRPMLDAGYVYFGCRDQHFYCLDRKTGKEVWKTKLESPIVTTAALASDKPGGPTSRLYVPASAGSVYCLAADSGKVRWRLQLGENLQVERELFSSPFVEEAADGKENRRIYFGMTLVTTNRAGSLACYKEVTKK